MLLANVQALLPKIGMSVITCFEVALGKSLILSFLILFSIYSYSLDVGISVESENYSDILSVGQLVDEDWSQMPKSDASTAFTQSQVSFFIRGKYWKLSVAERFDYIAKTNGDTARAFYLGSNKHELDAEDIFNVDLSVEYLRARGLLLERKWQVTEGVNLYLELGAWQLTRYHDSWYRGVLQGENLNDINGRIEYEEVYAKRNFLRRPNRGRWDETGMGYSLNSGLDWKIDEHWHLEFRAKDLTSKFEINKAGFTQATMDSEGVSFEGSLLQDIGPIISGRETTKQHKMSVPKRFDLNLGYALQQENKKQEYGRWITHYRRQVDTDFLALGYSKVLKNVQFTVAYDVLQSIPQISIQGKYFSLDLASRSLDLDDTPLFNLGCSFYLSF